MGLVICCVQRVIDRLKRWAYLGFMPQPIQSTIQSAPPAQSLGRQKPAGSTKDQVTLPLRWVLTGILGALMLSFAIALFWIAFGAGFKNTDELLRDKAQLFLEMMTTRLDQHVQPAKELSAYLADRMADGSLDPKDRGNLKQALSYTFASAPQLNAAVYVDVDGWYLTVFQDQDGVIRSEIVDWQADQAIATQILDLHTMPRGEVFWGAPIYSEAAETSLIFVGQPVYIDDVLRGTVVATLRLEDLAAFIADLGKSVQATAFIIYDQTHVLAHPKLTDPQGLIGLGTPLPTVADLDDPVLGGFRSGDWQKKLLHSNTNGHHNEIDGRDYIYLYRDLPDFRPKMWTVGAYFHEEIVGEQFRRLFSAFGLALAALVAAILLCLFIAHKMARPAVTTAHAAMQVSRLELDQITPLPRSMIKEPDEIGLAFNRMIHALTFFARYVPKALVQKLIAVGELPPPEERSLTVMFTDIRGFTSLASQLGPTETAKLLNEHFAILGDIIERHGGTVDKYMGDGAMAFWGAPDAMADHAHKACAAALEIRTAIIAHNAQSSAPVAMRIGIATGRILVGDIGSAARMNYTVVGEAVNVAQRLESFGRELLAGEDVAILIDRATAAGVELTDRIRDEGEHRLRGLNRTMQIYSLRPA